MFDFVARHDQNVFSVGDGETLDHRFRITQNSRMIDRNENVGFVAFKLEFGTFCRSGRSLYVSGRNRRLRSDNGNQQEIA